MTTKPRGRSDRGLEQRKVDGVEIHFGKPVVARVRKCRLVVVKNRLQPEDEKRAEEQADD